MTALAGLQGAFARHIRNPALHAAPAGVEPRRMRIYNELIYNTVEGFVAGGFPVLRSLLEDREWHELVRRFLDIHRCQTPYFLRIAEEFLDFVGAQDLALPPFAAELCHYEWVELALDVAQDEAPSFLADADLLAGVPVLSPLAWPLAYAWPVHRICRDFQPLAPPAEPTCLLVYRDAGERVRYVELNAPSLRLLELVAPGTLSGRAVLSALASELGDAGTAVTGEAGAAQLARFAALGVIGIPWAGV